MQPIDKPFRPGWDFCVVWVLMALAVYLTVMRHGLPEQPWYSYTGILILLSLFATLLIYGPVLLARQIIRSGSRGRFVASVFVSTVLAAALFTAILYSTGHAEHRPVVPFVMSFIAILYLHSRIDDRSKA